VTIRENLHLIEVETARQGMVFIKGLPYADTEKDSDFDKFIRRVIVKHGRVDELF
jgi:hypothetical protein